MAGCLAFNMLCIYFVFHLYECAYCDEENNLYLYSSCTNTHLRTHRAVHRTYAYSVYTKRGAVLMAFGCCRHLPTGWRSMSKFWTKPWMSMGIRLRIKNGCTAKMVECMRVMLWSRRRWYTRFRFECCLCQTKTKPKQYAQEKYTSNGRHFNWMKINRICCE